jgi:two-component system sensor histidine kinase and response regulator WspE
MSTFDAPQIDPAMLELFQAEMDTHIPVLNEGLLALEKGQAAAGEIEAMMRAAHSIKGAARIVGIEPAVRVAHVMEDCFTAAKESRIQLSSDSVDVLLQGVDMLQRICAPLSGAPVTETDLQQLVAQLGLLKDGGVPTRTSEPASPRTEVNSAALVAATVERDEPSVLMPAVFDQQSSESLRRELSDTLSLSPARIQLDFAQVEELGASGLALLASFAREVGRAEPTPAIESRGMRPTVQAVLRVAGLDASLVPGAQQAR